MANLFGAIGLQDSDRPFNSVEGQRVLYEETAKLVTRYNEDLAIASAVFVGGTTEFHQERFRLPGGGRMQARGRNARPGAVKVVGSWDVAYPLLDFADQIAHDDISYAYMTVAEYSTHLQNITIRDANTYREEMLRALFNNSPWNFVDELRGTLAVQPLANGDGALYPPKIGEMNESTDNHYLATSYNAGDISNTNNPIRTIVDKIEERIGARTGGNNIAVFYNAAQHDKLSALAGFVEVEYRHIQPGTSRDTVTVPGIPDELTRGSWQITGTCDNAVLCKWPYIPAGYLLAIHTESPPPLIERIDLQETGLGSGLQLVTQDEKVFPFNSAFWRHRFGLGVRNRLNGVVMHLSGNGTYATPAAYA